MQMFIICLEVLLEVFDLFHFFGRVLSGIQLLKKVRFQHLLLLFQVTIVYKAQKTMEIFFTLWSWTSSLQIQLVDILARLGEFN